MDTEVLIVGAGPTGLMLANQLARRGIRALLVDRHSGPAQQTRAIGVQARTLEIYAKLGVIEQALELGERTAGANLWASGKHKARIPVGDIGKSLSPFPFLLMLGQDDTERILGAKLRAAGNDIHWNTELVALEQVADHAVATLQGPDGARRTVTATWVAGCDGSHSAVRKFCGIGFPGAPYEQVFFVADTRATGEMVPAELNVYLWKSGFHLFFPMHGSNRWRLIGILPPHLRDQHDVTLDDVLPHLQQAAGASFRVARCDWFSTYRIHHCSAARFRDRRCFLLGDAAHVHSPMGAQGMNTGLQDAYNLAWKLTMVTKGQAGTELLESYEAERTPVAQRLLRTTDRMFRLVVSNTWVAGMLRTRVIARAAALAMCSQRIQRLLFRTISQIGIRYRHSPLSRTLPGIAEDAPRAGDRFPWLQLRLAEGGTVEDIFDHLDDTRYNLIVVGQAPTAAVPRLDAFLQTLVIPGGEENASVLAAAKITGSRFFLCRPDGHIGLAGTILEWPAIDDYLKDCHVTAVSGAATRQANG